MRTISLAIVIAQSAPTNLDPISGGAGWVGAGLLGGVLGWLLFLYLPSKDKQLKELVESKDSQLREMAKEFRLDLDKIVAAFHTEMGAMRSEVYQPVSKLLERLTATLKDRGN